MQTNELTAPLMLALWISLAFSVILSGLRFLLKEQKEEQDEETDPVEKRAVILCSGLNRFTNSGAEYQGMPSCSAVKQFSGAVRSCEFACLGFGDCVKACPKNAITVCEGLAHVDRRKCDGCGKCTDICPQKLIRIYPKSQRVIIACNSEDREEERRGTCDSVCIGYGLCEKVCEKDALHIINGTAHIDENKCDSCGKCIEICPNKCIKRLN